MAKTWKIKKSNASTKVQPSKVTTTAPKTAPSKVPLNRVEGSKIQGKRPRRKQQVADPSSSENEDVNTSESEKEQPKRKKPKAAESPDEDSFDDTSEEEANERPTVPLPRVTRSQAAKETIDVDKINDDSQQDDDDDDDDEGTHTADDEQELDELEDDDDTELRTPQPSSDGLSDLTPLPSVTSFRKKFLSVKVPQLTTTQRAMYTPMVSSTPGTPSASASRVLEAAQRLSASERMSSKIVAPPPKRPQVLTTEASMVFNPTKVSKDKVPATFEIKGSTPAGSDDHVFLDLPQSPTALIRFNDLEWGDKRNDWAPASTTLPATYKDSAFNHPPPGEPVTSSFLPSPHEKVWVQVGFGEAFAWGRLQRSKHKSFYHDYISVFKPVNKTYHPLPNGFIPPQPGVIPSLNDLRRDAKLRRAERVDPPLSSPAPTTIPTIHSGTQATERRHTEPTEPGRGYQGRPSMEPSKLSSTDGPAPGSSIQPKKVAPSTESGKLGKPSSKARLRNVAVTEEQDVDGSTVDPPLSKRHPSKVTITEERDVDAPPLEAKQTSSNAPILELATPNEEDDKDLDALAPSVRAHKKGKFRSGRLSKCHFARAEKAQDLSHPVDSTEFLLVDIIQSRGWDGPMSRAKVIHSGKYMAEDWSGNPADRSRAQEYTTLNSLMSAMHDLDQPMPDSPGHQDDEGDESDPVPAPVQTRRKATKKPRSRTARHPVAISEDEEDNDDPVPHYTSQPPVAGPSRQPPSVPTP
ncbi:hypothetical protein BKA70DRAFT_1449243 [Coprinopsis sp. MPI-PUGE-AT-0042]|nr:hypothetical protein BKA70DRAFT_1449243 [Coprinopsis sp. MPI-PUGE-AT-0042]